MKINRQKSSKLCLATTTGRLHSTFRGFFLAIVVNFRILFMLGNSFVYPKNKIIRKKVYYKQSIV